MVLLHPQHIEFNRYVKSLKNSHGLYVVNFLPCRRCTQSNHIQYLELLFGELNCVGGTYPGASKLFSRFWIEGIIFEICKKEGFQLFFPLQFSLYLIF